MRLKNVKIFGEHAKRYFAVSPNTPKNIKIKPISSNFKPEPKQFKILNHHPVWDQTRNHVTPLSL
jgi:hypothetical protein